MSESLVYVYTYVKWFVFLMFAIAIGIYYTSRTDLSEITKVYSELSAVQGGFTKSLYDDMLDDLSRIGFPSNEIDVRIKAVDPNGTDITSKARNVTPKNTTPYPSNPNYCPRGTKITLEVISKKKAIVNNMFESMGISSNIKKGHSKRVFMSERVR